MDQKQKLIKALSDEQKNLQLTDEQFAKLLGVNRTTWIWVKTGVNNPGLRVLAGVAKSFPELKVELIEYLEAYLPDSEGQLMAAVKPKIKVVKRLHPIQRRCRELGITQRELARRMKVSEATICNWISGRIILSSSDLSSIILRKTLGIDEDYMHR